MIRISEKYYRPSEVENLLGDASKARKILGWKPKITLEQMINDMIINDSEIAKRELNLNT